MLSSIWNQILYVLPNSYFDKKEPFFAAFNFMYVLLET